MTTRKPTLNNMSIQNYRRNPLYQAIITDLCFEGIVPKEMAEGILAQVEGGRLVRCVSPAVRGYAMLP